MANLKRILVPLGALALLAGACGSDDDKEDAQQPPEGATAEAAELAAGTVDLIVPFDAAAGQQSEGIAIDSDGNIFASWSFQGKVVRIPAGTTTPEEFGSVPVAEGDFGVVGLDLDPDGNLYAAVFSSVSNGAWRFDAATGEATQLEGTEAIGFPNDVALDDAGNLYITSSSEGTDDAGAQLGAIWRVAPDGATEQWMIDEMLGGTGESGLPVGPVGANGIEFFDGSLYLTNLEKGQVLRVEIAEDGAPGAASVVAEAAELGGADGLALDPLGNMFVAVIGQSSIVRVGTDGVITTVATDEDGLDFPSAVEFGRGDSSGSLFGVNFAIAELLGAVTVEGPGVFQIPAATTSE